MGEVESCGDDCGHLVTEITEVAALAETANNQRIAVQAETLLGEVHLAMGDEVLADRWLNRALETAWTVEGREVVPVALRGIGAVQSRRQHFAAAERTFTQALAMARWSDNRMLVGRLLLDLDSLCQGMGDDDRATAFNTKALSVFGDLGAARLSRIAQEQRDRAVQRTEHPAPHSVAAMRRS